MKNFVEIFIRKINEITTSNVAMLYKIYTHYEKFEAIESGMFM